MLADLIDWSKLEKVEVGRWAECDGCAFYGICRGDPSLTAICSSKEGNFIFVLKKEQNAGGAK